MRYLRESSEQEMVAEFLKGELNSPRWAAKIKALAHQLNIPTEIIRSPGLENLEHNDLRAKLLTKFRGFSERKGVFSILPGKVKWQLYELNKNDILNLNYVSYSYWDKLSQGTHLVKRGVETVFEDEEIFGQSNQQFYKVATDIEHGIKLPPLILIKKEESGHYIIIEGNVRATSIGLARVNDFKIKAIIGLKT
jgi:hypothetical protein